MGVSSFRQEDIQSKSVLLNQFLFCFSIIDVIGSGMYFTSSWCHQLCTNRRVLFTMEEQVGPRKTIKGIFKDFFVT